MAGAGVPADRYLVFCKLLRAGYIVQRHPARWMLKPTDDPAAAWAGWGVPPAAEGAAAAQSGPGGAGAAAGQPPPQQPAVPVAPPAGPPRKRRRVEPQVRSMRWWGAGPAAASQQQQQPQQPQQPDQQPEPQPQPQGDAQQAPPDQQQQQQQADEQQAPAAGGDGGTGLPWLHGCLPAGFQASLPRCTVAPDAAQRARADFPRMAPLASLPLPDLLPPGGAAGGRHLLVRRVEQRLCRAGARRGAVDLGRASSCLGP